MKGALRFQGFGVFTVRGDLNDDGYNDLIVAAPSDHALTTPPGRVFVYFGSDTFDTTSDWQAEGLNSTWQFGINIGVGDLNADGIDDLVVGEVNVEIDSGMVHIYYGGSGFDTVKDLTLTTSQSNGFGRYFAVGDITGDLINDLAVYDFGTSSYRIYFGGTNFDAAEDDVLPHNDWPPDIGDVNGDGVGDLIIGNNELNSVDIFLGGSPFDHEIDGRVFGEGSSTGFSRELDYLGDVNGDGDFIAGAVYAGTPGATEGRAYLFLGDTSGVISVEPDPVSKPKSYSILSAYPNPFNSSVQIQYEIKRGGRVHLRIYNIRGELVSTLLDKQTRPGTFTAAFKADGLPSGIYIVKLTTEYDERAIKTLLIK